MYWGIQEKCAWKVACSMQPFHVDGLFSACAFSMVCFKTSVSSKIHFPVGTTNRSKYIMWNKLFVCELWMYCMSMYNNNMCVLKYCEPLSLVSSVYRTVGFLPAFEFRNFSIYSFCLYRSFNRANIHWQNINKSIKIKRFRCFFSVRCFLLFVCWYSEKRRNSHKLRFFWLASFKPAFFTLISDCRFIKRILYGILFNQSIKLFGFYSV